MNVNPRPLLALLGMLAICSTARAIDIPKLDKAVDADPAHWSTHGLIVGVMHSSLPRIPIEYFDAQLRIAWNENGLLVLAEVTDSDIHECDDEFSLTNGTSIDIAETDSHGDNAWRLNISPGIDPRHPRLRTFVSDERSRMLRTSVPECTTVTQKTATGYIVETQLPWSILSIAPKPGTEIGLSVQIKHVGAGRTSQLYWSPRPTLRLGNDASVVVSFAADGAYERLQRTNFTVVTTANDAKSAEIRSGEIVVGHHEFSGDGRLRVADIAAPMPPIDHPFGPLVVWVDGKSIEPVAIRNADDERRNVAADLRLVASPSVFTIANLPSVDFNDRVAAEAVFGKYRLQTAYYDVDYNPVTAADKPGRYGAVVEVTPEFGKPFKRFITLYRAPAEANLRPLHLQTPLHLPSKLGLNDAIVAGQTTAAGDYIGWAMRDGLWQNSGLAIYLAGVGEIDPGTINLPTRLGPAGRDTTWWYGLKKKLGILRPYPFLIHIPDPKPSDKLPLILFLHGSGQRGDDLASVKHNGPPDLIENERDWAPGRQFIVVSPQCPDGQEWNPLLLRDLLDELVAKYPVDPDRIYLTGLSLGGIGTWELATWFPERFAAIAPVCGAGDPSEVSRLADIPTWIFHGQRDNAVRIECAYEMVAALRAIHGRVRFTLYRDRSHNSWLPAYDDPKLYDWLLQQKRGLPSQVKSQVAGTEPSQ